MAAQVNFGSPMNSKNAIKWTLAAVGIVIALILVICLCAGGKKKKKEGDEDEEETTPDNPWV